MSPVSDAQLVRRAQRGDKAAFGELFTRYEGRIFGYLYRMVGDRAWAEDLAQEAFIRAHQHLNRLGPPYDFKSWIYRIAANLAIDGLRRHRPEAPLPDWDAGEATGPEPADERGGTDPEQEVRRAEVRQAVWRTLHNLPEGYRQILLLRELEGLSYQEIADILGISLDNVKVTLHRARLAFRDLYGLQVMVEEGRWACHELDELLSAEVDGELDRATRRRVKRHIAACPVCQRTRRELLAVSNLLALLAPVFPPSTLRPRFLTRLQHLPPPQPAAPPSSPTPASSGGGGTSGPGKALWLALAGGIGGVVFLAAAVLLALAVFFRGAFPSPTPSPAPPSPTTAPSSPAPTPPSPSPTLIPSPTPMPTLLPPSPPPPILTSTPLPPPPTPTPAASIAFWADATTVPAGTCTTIHWEVEHVQAVFFDGRGVPGVGAEQVCPCAAERHALDVVLRDGTHDVRTLVIQVTGSCVTPTPDTQGPSAPRPLDPIGDVTLSCRSQVTLSWSPASDPSGIAGYYVHLEEVVFTREPQSWEWGPIRQTQYDVLVSCGFSYRWAVRAEDGAGNLGPWSDWAAFGVGID